MTSSESTRRLPIGVRTFREIREECDYYVDKTEIALRLAETGYNYCLSRPRRFGKSLFVDTLKELFEGNRELFKGLAVEPQWDWSTQYPVVRLAFGKGDYAEPGQLQANVAAQLEAIEEAAGLQATSEYGADRLARLLARLHRESRRRVVLLVDEYDKPILDALHVPEMARANRDYLLDLYSVTKSCGEHIHLSFLAGVSKLSPGTLFSGLNNLINISLDSRYSSICGYTENDLDTVFGDRLAGLDRDRMREWYNGYSWGGDERVYNPFDLLRLFDTGEYSPWWFETGTPKFLTNLLLEQQVAWHRLDGLTASDHLLSQFEVENINAETLLFQMGYLTILEEIADTGLPYYRLGYPNREVRESLNAELLNTALGSDWQREHQADRLREVLEAGDGAGVEESLRALAPGVPYQWPGESPRGTYAAWFASVLYAHLVALGANARPAQDGSWDRENLVVKGRDRVWLFEFKMQEQDEPSERLQQLQQQKYIDRYRRLGKPIDLVGMEFSAKTHDVTGFESQTIWPDGKSS